MWVAPTVLLAVLGTVLFVVPFLYLAAVLDGILSGRRRVHTEPRAHCVHELVSAATGIACPCVTRSKKETTVVELASPLEPEHPGAERAA